MKFCKVIPFPSRGLSNCLKVLLNFLLMKSFRTNFDMIWGPLDNYSSILILASKSILNFLSNISTKLQTLQKKHFSIKNSISLNLRNWSNEKLSDHVDSYDWQSEMYLNQLSDSYFYLSLENSDHCFDYVTEKFYFALNSTAVPVVFGYLSLFHLCSTCLLSFNCFYFIQ